MNDKPSLFWITKCFYTVLDLKCFLHSLSAFRFSLYTYLFYTVAIATKSYNLWVPNHTKNKLWKKGNKIKYDSIRDREFTLCLNPIKCDESKCAHKIKAASIYYRCLQNIIYLTWTQIHMNAFTVLDFALAHWSGALTLDLLKMGTNQSPVAIPSIPPPPEI